MKKMLVFLFAFLIGFGTLACELRSTSISTSTSTTTTPLSSTTTTGWPGTTTSTTLWEPPTTTTTRTSATGTTTTVTTTTSRSVTTTTHLDLCEVDFQNVCIYDDGDTQWEEGQIVTVGVSNYVLAQAIGNAWNEAFPNYMGMVQGVYYETAESTIGGVSGVLHLQENAPDIVMVLGSKTIGNWSALLDLSDYLNSDLVNQVLQSAFHLINGEEQVQYLPLTFDGIAFAWNKSMFEYFNSSGQLSVSLTDANGDNLPEAFDTWEEIFALSDSFTVESAGDYLTFQYRPDAGNGAIWESTITEWFPLCLDQEYSNYAAYTAGGWQLFPEGDYADPGFASAEFLGGLDFIREFSTHGMSLNSDGTRMASTSMGWRWERFLNNYCPFGLVGTWMNFDGMEDESNTDFVFSPMPTYRGNSLTPLVSSKGFAINRYSSCPGAAVKVLKWLYTQEGLTVISKNSPFLLALEPDSSLYPVTLTDNQRQFSLALGSGHLEPAAFLPLSTSVTAVTVLYNVGLSTIQRAVWDGTITPEDAQELIVSAAASWILTNNIAD